MRDEALAEEAPEQPPMRLRERLMRREWAGALALGAALAGVSFVRYGAGAHALVGAIFCPALVLLSAIDLRHRVLPDIIVKPAAGAITVVVAVGERHHLVTHLAVAVAGWAIVLAAALLRPGAMGWGDAKLVFLIGIALGSRTAAVVIYVFLLVVAISLYLLLRHGRGGLKRKIAFGPVLAFAALIAYFTG
jgi:leader peptidase (prepilin peptidase) / N-methyltransferase